MKAIITGKLMTNLVFFIFVLICGETGICSADPNAKMVMTQAVICESILQFQPVNPAVAFSISQGEVYCFSSFNPVLEKTVVIHKWYKRDKLVFTMKLTLLPPKWSSFSRIQIRDADKGPWRVEIQGVDGVLFQTLRFSMVD